MRFLLMVMSGWLVASIASAKVYENPRAVAMLAASEALVTDAAVARYKAPGDTQQFVDLLRALSQPVASLGDPSLDLHTPAQIYPNGQVKVMLVAAKSWMTADMMHLRAQEVEITSYREDGSVEAVITADEIAVDRTSMRAAMRGKVSFSLGKERLTGNGALVDFNSQYIRILSQAKIVSSRVEGADFSMKELF